MRDDPPTWVREALFGGTGTVTVRDLLRGSAAPPFGAVLGCTLAPGGSVGRHRQEALPEIVIGVAGEGEAEVDGATHPLCAGDVVWLPLGGVLSIRNLSAEMPLEYLIVKAQG